MIKKTAYKHYLQKNLLFLYIFASSMIFIGFLTDTIMYCNQFATETLIANLIPLILIPIIFLLGLKGKLKIENSYAIIAYITIFIIFTVIFLNYIGIEPKNYQQFRMLISTPLLILSVALISGYKHTVITGAVSTVLVSVSLLLTGTNDLYELHIYASFLLISTTIAMARFVRSLEETMTKMHEQQNIINNQNEILDKVSKEKDKMFSIIAHDLRGPVGLTKEILDYWSEEDISNEEKDELINLLKNSTSGTYQLLDNLLTWAKSNKNEIVFNPKEQSVNKTVDNAIAFCKLTANTKGIHFENEVHTDVLAFFDSDMISTVLRNLVSNSIKYSKRHGHILISSKVKNNYVQICVHDNGVGIEDNKIKKLFSDENITVSLGTDNEKGSGLGLKICNNFVKINGGNLNVESKFEKGTTFTFTIPINLSKN